MMFSLTPVNLDACKNISLETHQNNCQEIQNLWIQELVDLTKSTVGYTAPVSARSFMYFNIAFYESSIGILPENKSLAKQLNGFEREFQSLEGISVELLCNQVSFYMVSHLYKNMPPAKLKKVIALKETINNTYQRGVSKKSRALSDEYAQVLANEIIQWSILDGGDEGYARNFPDDYVINQCDSCWVRTFPGYKNALQPYWGQNKLMITSNGSISDDIPYIGFSEDTNSVIYKDAKKLYELNHNGLFTNEMKDIADYWNDAPGYSGTPAGHFFGLAMQLAKERDVSFETSVTMFAALGIAINDAVIETFRLKYKFNLLRPITYIQKYIGKDFNTVIPSPAFPEFPSGHSYQSGAGSEVLKSFLTDDFPFADSANVGRVDINGKARNFESLTDLSEEMSISRHYGGIHFLYTLETSLVYGRKIGVNTLQKIQFRK